MRDIPVHRFPGASRSTSRRCLRSGIAHRPFCFRRIPAGQGKGARTEKTIAPCRMSRGPNRRFTSPCTGYPGDASRIWSIPAIGARSCSAFLGRELTKLHEQCVAASTLGTGCTACSQTADIPPKGEFVVIVVAGDAASCEPESRPRSPDASMLYSRSLLDVMPGKQAVTAGERVPTGGQSERNDLYKRDAGD